MPIEIAKKNGVVWALVYILWYHAKSIALQVTNMEVDNHMFVEEYGHFRGQVPLPE